MDQPRTPDPAANAVDTGVDRCRSCGTPLRPCPAAEACPGSRPWAPGTCMGCSWGLACPVHGRAWTGA
jgi:hypothetical protein